MATRAVRQLPPGPARAGLARVLRGYDQKQVDAHIEHVRAPGNPPRA